MKNKLAALTIALTVSTAPAVGAEMTEADEIHYAPIMAQSHLFRPLGYKIPDRTPRWKLLATKVVGKDALTGTWAYMTRSNSPVRGGAITVIKEGVEFAGSIVKEITNRKVILENGDSYEQPAIEFLDRPTGKRKSNVSRSQSSADDSTGSARDSQQETSSRSEGVQRRQGRARGQGGNSRWREQMGRFQNASPEEQSRMIEQFRSQRGGGRGGGRRGR